MSAEKQSRDTVRFVLNGEPCVVRAPDPNATLLNYLRYEARLTGTKEGCAEGDCGACTVAVVERDGAGVRWKPINACIHFLAMVDGREVVTTEGLKAPDGALHPIQKCFVDRHAAQCGFCTPGFLVSLAVARLQKPIGQSP